MDSKTSVKSLKSLVQQFCEARDWGQFHGPKDLTIGIVTEASELLAHFRFKTEVEAKAFLNDPKRRRQIEDETADTLFMLLRFAQMYDIDLTKALKRKVASNKTKYPIRKSKGSNKKYNEK
jgi:NTP pyrophosphatase (non-canonical NTP hydrolase)